MVCPWKECDNRRTCTKNWTSLRLWGEVRRCVKEVYLCEKLVYFEVIESEPTEDRPFGSSIKNPRLRDAIRREGRTYGRSGTSPFVSREESRLFL